MIERDEAGLDLLDLEKDGARLCRAAIEPASLAQIADAFAGQPDDQAGVRLFGQTGLRRWLDRNGRLGALAADAMGDDARPVRAILFNKTANRNWSLPWHQDRVIAVRRRIEVEGFGAWTRKHGALHVAPPFWILARMLTLRLHLDAAQAENAPLLVAPGSHRFGRIAADEAAEVARRCGRVACLAEPGDVWLYATSILHASHAVLRPTARRVLQVDFAAEELPGGLEWLGV
jgi:hypothetical protein